MKLSAKGRYAVTAMMELAIHENQRPVTLAEISEKQAVSVSYLEQLFARMRHKGLVNGMRGPGGGYTLARPASEVTIAEIIDVVDEQTTAFARDPIMDNSGSQRTRLLWQGLSARIHGFLDSLTLADVIQIDNDSLAGGVSENKRIA
jgi:Rrf2 family iron-sulfur cluster assembly transcriptional regulator